MSESLSNLELEQLLLDPVAQSTIALRASESSLAYLYGTWLNTRSEETNALQKAARNVSATSFDLVVDVVLTDPDFEFEEKMAQLGTIYNELAKSRSQRFIELAPKLDPSSVLNHHHLQNYLGDFLKNDSVEDAAAFIKHRYRYELHNSLALVRASRDNMVPDYLKTGTYLTKSKRSQGYELLPAHRRVGSVAVAVFGLGAAWLIASKLKNRSAEGTE